MSNVASDLLQGDIEVVLPLVCKRFELIAQTGNESGFGAVWLAHDTWLDDRKVAIKISAHDLSEEVLLCRDIEGQTVRIYDYFRGKGSWNAYAMECLESPWLTISKWIDTHKYRQNDLQHFFDCFEILYDALRALSEIHGRPYSREGRYVHADIKPDNMFFLCKPHKRLNSVFRMPAHEDMVKIIDMGISTPRGVVNFFGTPAYDYPKKIESRLGHDLYSLGITFLEMVSGVLPDHHVMEHKARIRDFIAKNSSGSKYIDDLAVEIVRQCARAATRPVITARSVMNELETMLFDKSEVYLLALRALDAQLVVGKKKDELAHELFPVLAEYYGWANQTECRIDNLKELVGSMVEQGFLFRQENSYRYYLYP